MRYQILIIITSIILFTRQLQGAGIVNIKGAIKSYQKSPNKTTHDQVSIISNDPFEKTYIASIDAKGNFNLTFPKGFMGDVQFAFNKNKPVHVIVSPGDEQYYLIEPTTTITIVKFSGSNATINQQITDYIKARSGIWIDPVLSQRPYSMSAGHRPDLENVETFKRKMKFLEDYLRGHKLGSLFKLWASADIKFNYAFRHFSEKANQHNPITDSAFFKQFPINEPQNLISSNYLNYLYVVRNNALFLSSDANKIIARSSLSPFLKFFQERLDTDHRQVFNELLHYSNWTDSTFKANMNVIENNPDSLTKYRMPGNDRATINYIEQKTSGLVRDVVFSNYILMQANRESNIAPWDYRYPRLIATYKKLVPDGLYKDLLLK